MATRVQTFPPSIIRWLRRTFNSFRSIFVPGDSTALLIVFVMLLMPVLSLQVAGWPLAMGTLLPVAIFSLLFGFFLSRSHYNELLALIMSTIYGAALVLLISAINEPGGLGDGITSVFTRIFQWMTDAVSGGINQDELVFTMLVSALLWFLGYSAAWHVFRIDRVWRAIFPPALILITNSIYYNGSEDLDIYLIIFLFMALLLIVRSNLDAREWDWYVNGIRVPRRLRKQFFRMGAVLAVVALLIAWLIPTGNLQRQLEQFQEFLRGDPLTQMSEFWNRLFASAETQGPTTADYYGGDSLQLGGAIRLGDQEVFWVSAPPGRRYYWRSRIFDTYEGGRWLPAADTRLTDPQAPLDVVQEPYVEGSRVAVSQRFTMGLSASRLVYVAPQPLQVDLATKTDLKYVDGQAMNVSVIRPSQVIERGETYSATSLLSAATATQLRAAGVSYPQWVNGIYLYVSPSVTERTIQLARQIVTEANAVTPYDQAKAIETWLRQNVVYNETIPQPPAGRDPVDWLLFDIREGYCNYYASAMIVMLRSLGIPSRLAAGFAQGTWDAETQQFEVLERDAHTWVEVYFPNYGWIEFEPTAAQSPVMRVDDTEVVQQPSATPNATPTPSPSPTQDLTALPQEGRALPTITPTASPTATPVIVPTQPPPITPQEQGPLAFLLPILGAILLAIVTVLVLVAVVVFLWWWWEWRGMGGLSPVARAYARLGRYIPLIGVRLTEQQTPNERRQVISKNLPVAEPPVSAITRMYTAERYGRGPKNPMEVELHAEVADEAWTHARGSILRRWVRRLLMPWKR